MVPNSKKTETAEERIKDRAQGREVKKYCFVEKGRKILYPNYVSNGFQVMASKNCYLPVVTKILDEQSK
jgi:hypothetical protein